MTSILSFRLPIVLDFGRDQRRDPFFEKVEVNRMLGKSRMKLAITTDSCCLYISVFW